MADASKTIVKESDFEINDGNDASSAGSATEAGMVARLNQEYPMSG